MRLVLSFVLATALWLYVTGKQDPALSSEFPQPLLVAQENLAPSLAVTNTIPAVHVWYRNNPSIPVTATSFHPYIDLSNLGPGRYRRIPVHVVPDPGIQFSQVSPAAVPVVVEPLQAKHVPVRVHFSNSPPEGYHVDSVQLQPSIVVVSGPKSVVSQVAQVGVYADLSGDRFSLEGPYTPEAENSQGQIIVGRPPTIRPAEISVKINIRALTSYKTLPVLVPIKGQPKTGFGVVGLTVQPPEITAIGPPTTLNHISSASTSAVSISGRKAGTFTTRVKIQPPRGILTDRRTQWVTVKIQLAAVQSSSSIEVGVSPINLGSGLVVHTRPYTVLVTAVGSSSALRGAAGQIRATVNLGGLGAGTYQLKPIVTAPTGLHVDPGDVYPSVVTVVLTPGS